MMKLTMIVALGHVTGAPEVGKVLGGVAQHLAQGVDLALEVRNLFRHWSQRTIAIRECGSPWQQWLWCQLVVGCAAWSV